MFHSKICPIIHYILYLDYVTFIFYIQSVKIFSHWFSHQCSFEVAQNMFLIFSRPDHHGRGQRAADFSCRGEQDNPG